MRSNPLFLFGSLPVSPSPCLPLSLSLLLLLLLLLTPHAAPAQEKETEAAKAARLEKMPAEQKEELSRKKQRFEGLAASEQERLRGLHAAIASDPRKSELEDTVQRYNQWLATLTSPQRAALLTIQDPQERIARIKELIQLQAEQRFHAFLPNLPDDDRKVTYKWVGDFVTKHAAQIRQHMPREWQDRLTGLDEEARRRELARTWSWRYRRQEPGAATPTKEEFAQLFTSLSAETRQWIEQTSQSTDAKQTDDQRQARLVELIRAATFSRFFPSVSREELLKFYTAMKADDPRRERLEPLEGESLYRELRTMYFAERFGGPSGQRGPPRPGGGPPGPPPPPGDHPEFKGFGKRPPM